MGAECIDLTSMQHHEEDAGEEDADDDDKRRMAVGSLRKGTVRMTQSLRDRHDPLKVSFDDVFRPTQGMTKCVLTSYVIDEPWLLSKLRNVPSVILCTDDGSRAPHSRVVTRGNRTLIIPPFPKFPSYGVMHSKLMLLFHGEYLRVVISSGNLVPYDYDQMVFVQDLPRVASSAAITDFQTDTLKLLRTLGIGEEQVAQAELTAYDWSRIRVKMVVSRPGMHYLSPHRENSTGLAALARAVEPSTRTCTYECLGSSLGSIDKAWLEDVHCCFQGRLPTPTTRKRSESSDARVNYAGIRVKIVFPTMAYVLESPEGVEGFGTIFCQAKHWEAPHYPHQLFHRAESQFGRGQALHAKIIAAVSSDDDQPAWFYVGSANFTPSAWGKFVKEKRAIVVANYELGIVFGAEEATELCPGGFPFPYQRPLQRYAQEDAPWMQEILRPPELR